MFSFSRKRGMESDTVLDIELMEEKQVEGAAETRVIIPKVIEETVRNDDMAKDLAYLVDDAITVWTNKYELQNLPRDIILDQVISILMTVKDAMR